MNLGERWTGGYTFGWRMSLELKQATRTLISWRPGSFQLAQELEVRLHLDDQTTCKAGELLIRAAFLRHPWKLNLASTLISEFFEVVAPEFSEQVARSLPFLEPEQWAEGIPPIESGWLLPRADGEPALLTSAKSHSWTRESATWLGFIVAQPECVACKGCRGPRWDLTQPCPTCGRRSRGLLQRLRNMAWLLNTPRVD